MALHSTTTFHKPEVKLVSILGTTAQGTACTVVRSFKVAQNHRDINSSNMKQHVATCLIDTSPRKEQTAAFTAGDAPAR